MGEAAPSNPSPKSYYSMDCECRAHAAIFLARQEAACDPFSALDLSVDKFHLRQHAQHQVAISASVRIIARSLQHRRVAWMHDFRDLPTRRSSHSTNPEVERRRPRRDTAPPNFRVFKVNQPVLVKNSLLVNALGSNFKKS